MSTDPDRKHPDDAALRRHRSMMRLRAAGDAMRRLKADPKQRAAHDREYRSLMRLAAPALEGPAI